MPVLTVTIPRSTPEEFRKIVQSLKQKGFEHQTQDVSTFRRTRFIHSWRREVAEEDCERVIQELGDIGIICRRQG